MVKAYLRHPDLIPPDYPNKDASRIREGLILKIISCEDNFNRRKRKFDLDTATLGLLSEVGRQATLESIAESQLVLDCLEDYNLQMAAYHSSGHKRAEVKDAYDILDDHGYWDKVRDFTAAQWNEIIQEIKERIIADKKKAAEGSTETSE